MGRPARLSSGRIWRVEADERGGESERVVNARARLERKMLKRSTMRKKQDVRLSTQRKVRVGGDVVESWVLVVVVDLSSRCSSVRLLRHCSIFMKASVFCSTLQSALERLEHGFCTE